MADDNTLRTYRTQELPRRDSTDDPPTGSDPLAELARLIGQTDPFAEFGRANPRESQPAAPQPAASEWRRSDGYDSLRMTPEAHDDYRDPYPTAPHADDLHIGDHQDHDPRYDEASLAPEYAQDHAAAPQEHADASYAHDEEHALAADEDYDDPPRTARKAAVASALLMLGCAVIGGASAYGYRTLGSGIAWRQSTPPVITADKTPIKVVSAASEAPSNKAIQDRVGEAASNERVVSREEQPLELREPASSSVPRMVLPTPVAVAPAASPFGPPPTFGPPPVVINAAPAPSSSPPPAVTASAAPASGGAEPKRIRTVTIRSDGSDLRSANPPAAREPVGSTRAAPVAKPAPRNNGGPISLDPQAQAQALEPPAAPPPAASTRPVPATRLASTTAEPAHSGGGGAYVVQLSSQKTESEAQASYRSLQAKYPHMLSGKSPIVRRADLGAKGVFYRAMVGPFASSDEAGNFCSGLKAAGGQCIVQRN